VRPACGDGASVTVRARQACISGASRLRDPTAHAARVLRTSVLKASRPLIIRLAAAVGMAAGCRGGRRASEPLAALPLPCLGPPAASSPTPSEGVEAVTPSLIDPGALAGEAKRSRDAAPFRPRAFQLLGSSHERLPRDAPCVARCSLDGGSTPCSRSRRSHEPRSRRSSDPPGAFGRSSRVRSIIDEASPVLDLVYARYATGPDSVLGPIPAGVGSPHVADHCAPMACDHRDCLRRVRGVVIMVGRRLTHSRRASAE